MFMAADLQRIVTKEVRYWGAFDTHSLFDQLGVQYTHALILSDHPVVQLLDPDSQTAHFEKHTALEEKAKNESALGVMVRGKVRYPCTFIIEIGDEFEYGLFAGDHIPKGTFIGEYSGVLTWKGNQPVL